MHTPKSQPNDVKVKEIRGRKFVSDVTFGYLIKTVFFCITITWISNLDFTKLSLILHFLTIQYLQSTGWNMTRPFDWQANFQNCSDSIDLFISSDDIAIRHLPFFAITVDYLEQRRKFRLAWTNGRTNGMQIPCHH